MGNSIKIGYASDDNQDYDYGVTALVDVTAETKEYIDEKCDHVLDVIHRKKWKDRARYTDKRKNSVRREKRWK